MEGDDPRGTRRAPHLYVRSEGLLALPIHVGEAGGGFC